MKVEGQRRRKQKIEDEDETISKDNSQVFARREYEGITPTCE